MSRSSSSFSSGKQNVPPNSCSQLAKMFCSAPATPQLVISAFISAGLKKFWGHRRMPCAARSHAPGQSSPMREARLLRPKYPFLRSSTLRQLRVAHFASDLEFADTYCKSRRAADRRQPLITTSGTKRTGESEGARAWIMSSQGNKACFARTSSLAFQLTTKTDRYGEKTGEWRDKSLAPNESHAFSIISNFTNGKGAEGEVGE